MSQSITWNKIEAQQKFLELLEAVHQNPQLITDDQGKVVAAVIEIETFQEFLNWNQQEKRVACLADIALRAIKRQLNIYFFSLN